MLAFNFVYLSNPVFPNSLLSFLILIEKKSPRDVNLQNSNLSDPEEGAKKWRTKGGIEPLGFYASTDLKSALRAIEGHPCTYMSKKLNTYKIFTSFQFVGKTHIIHKNMLCISKKLQQ